MQGLKSMAFATSMSRGATSAPSAAAARSLGRRTVSPREVAPSRGLITPAALRLLRLIPLGEAGCDAFRIQRPGESSASARQLMKDTIDALTRRGAVHRSAAPRGEGRRGVEAGGAVLPVGEGLQSDDVTRACGHHGPVKLVMRLPRVGVDKQLFGSREIVVVLGTFPGPTGNTMALLLDGDVRQRNAVMDALKAWMASNEDLRDLHELTPEDFDAFNASRHAAGDAQSVHQLAFRVVDLDALLATAKAAPRSRYTPVQPMTGIPEQLPMVVCDQQVRTVQPLLSEHHRSLFQGLVDQDPSLVERLPRD